MVPRGQKRAKNPLVSAYIRTIRMYVPICVLQLKVSGLRNSKLELDIGYKEYSKLLVEIGTPEVDIYMKDFSFFMIFSKTAPTIIKKISVLIKCHELLVVNKF